MDQIHDLHDWDTGLLLPINHWDWPLLTSLLGIEIPDPGSTKSWPWSQIKRPPHHNWVFQISPLMIVRLAPIDINWCAETTYGTATGAWPTFNWATLGFSADRISLSRFWSWFSLIVNGIWIWWRHITAWCLKSLSEPTNIPIWGCEIPW